MTALHRALLVRWSPPLDPEAPDREDLVDTYNATHRRFLAASRWARQLAGEACQSGCHRAALEAVLRAYGAFRSARDALEDFDNAGIGEHRAVYG